MPIYRRQHPKGTLVQVPSQNPATRNRVGWIVQMCPCGACGDAQIEQTTHDGQSHRRWLPSSDYRVVIDRAAVFAFAA